MNQLENMGGSFTERALEFVENIDMGEWGEDSYWDDLPYFFKAFVGNYHLEIHKLLPDEKNNKIRYVLKIKIDKFKKDKLQLYSDRYKKDSTIRIENQELENLYNQICLEKFGRIGGEGASWL